MASTSAKELFILGRVSLRPTHGHEIMRTLRESRADLWVDLSEKHVYYILRKLDRDGLISASEERAGNLPTRRVYAITEAGCVALSGMFAAENLVLSRAYSDFNVLLGMLSYSELLSDEAKTEIVLKRQTALSEQLAALRDPESGRSPSVVDGFPRLMMTKIVDDLAAELDWLSTFMTQVTREGWSSMKPSFDPARTAVR